MPAAAAPDGAAQDGGSLIDTVTVPEAGFCIEVIPPPQLITIKATAMTREASKSETGWRFSQSWTWASMGASDLSKMKLCIGRWPGAGQNAIGEAILAAGTRSEY